MKRILSLTNLTNNWISVCCLLGIAIVGFISIQYVPAETTWNTKLMIRIPRVIEAVVIGAGLAVAGLAYQAAFKNPIVSPSILGVSHGAGIGAALCMLSSHAELITLGSAFTAILTVLLVWVVANLVSKDTASLLIIGVIISGIASSIMSLLKFVADPEGVLPAITYWLMGSLSGARIDHLPTLVILCIIIVLFHRFKWHLDILMLPSSMVTSSGLNERVALSIVVVGATLISALSTALAGVISMVGLAVPHAVRAIRGTDQNRIIFTDTALLGGLFVLCVDTLIRTAPLELPIGVLTNLFGALGFGAALLTLYKRGRSSYDKL